MNEAHPRVSVGMPVYNGEPYITQAIDSILSQTFTDFELIISDNASTDGTTQICRQYAAADCRVSYHRSDRNRGAAWNHNQVVELARGEYFKWQCHDDYCDPTFLEKCLAVVDSDPDVVLCYPQFIRVDELNRPLGVKSSTVLGEEVEPHLRFRSMIYRRDSCEEIYGLTRTAVMRKTALVGPYSNSDDTFLAELILHGRFREIPEPLFFYRIHSAQSTRAYPSRSERMAWFKPDATIPSFPSVRLFRGYISLLWRSPLPWREKLLCYSYLPSWCWHFKAWFRQDVSGLISSLTHEKCVPSITQHAALARPLWRRTRLVRKRWRRPESAASRAKRLQRAKLERWDLGPTE